MRKQWKQCQTLSFWAPKSLQMVTAAMKLKDAYSLEGKLARRSNQSILKEINPEYSLARLMMKLKLQYFGHLMQRTDSLEKTLMLGKIEGRRRRGWQDEMVKWHYQLDGHEFEQALGVGEGQGSLHAAVHGVAKSQTWLRDWTQLLNTPWKVKKSFIEQENNIWPWSSTFRCPVPKWVILEARQIP